MTAGSAPWPRAASVGHPSRGNESTPAAAKEKTATFGQANEEVLDESRGTMAVGRLKGARHRRQARSETVGRFAARAANT